MRGRRSARRIRAVRPERGGRRLGRISIPPLRSAARACCVRAKRLTAEARINQTTALSVTSAPPLRLRDNWKSRAVTDEAIHPFYSNVWDDYLGRVCRLQPDRERARFRQIHEGPRNLSMQPEDAPSSTRGDRGNCLWASPTSWSRRSARWQRLHPRRR